ncbi:MAG: hypothetical protein WCG47_18195 [Dermatophilaceae bacterium]
MDIKTMSAWLGHATAKLMLDTYGHNMETTLTWARRGEVERSLRHRYGTGGGGRLTLRGGTRSSWAGVMVPAAYRAALERPNVHTT